MKIIFSFFILLFFGFCSCPAQFINREYVNITQADGLPSNETYYIFRDSKNYLWVATDQGVIRYSGTSINQYSLADNIVFKIKEDSNGRIWFFTQSGRLSYFFKEKIYDYKYNDSIAKYIKNILIIDAFVENNEIQINSEGGYNYIINSKGKIFSQSYQPIYKNEPIKFQITNTGNSYYAKRVSYDGTYRDSMFIYFKGALHDSVYKFLFKENSFYQYGLIKKKSDLFFFNSRYLIKIDSTGRCTVKKFNADILSVNSDGKGIVWVGLIKGGAHLLNNELEDNTEPFFADKSITSITFDYEKGAWFSTLESGVIYLKYIYAKALTGNRALDQPVFRLFNFKDSALFFANAEGIYRKHKNEVTTILNAKMITANELFIDKNNLFFTGIGPSFSAGKKENYKPTKEIKNIFSFSSSHKIVKYTESKYLINSHTQLRIFDYNTFLQKQNVDAALTSQGLLNVPNIENVFIDNNKKIWITSRRGLYQLKALDTVPVLFQPRNGLFLKGVTTMKQVANGLFIIGLRFGGIVIMKETSVLLNITEKEGLINNSVKAILLDDDKVWVATANGISVISFQSYRPLKYSITNIGKGKGIYNLVIYQLAAFDKNIFAATSGGIYEIDKSLVFAGGQNSIIPFYISNINYYKGDTAEVESLTVPYNKSRILIKYNSICFNLPEAIEYYYRISGLDNKWKKIGSNELLLENLSPGSYKIEIKASIEKEQRFSEIRTLNITVDKPWEQYNLVRIAALMVIAALFFFLYKFRITKIRAEDKGRTDIKYKIAELEQKALRSQMNPHFIFNCLTSIQQLIISGKNNEANLYLVKFSRLIRATLEISLYPFVTIEDEKKYLGDYILLEQLRLAGSFEYRFIINDDIDVTRYEIPGMVLQPIIENSIRHGLKNTDTKGGVTISFTLKEDYFLCKITDNGTGYDDPAQLQTHKSYALKSIVERLAIYHNSKKEETFFEIANVVNAEGKYSGTEVTIKMPFKIKTDNHGI